jgi:putative chitinase
MKINRQEFFAGLRKEFGAYRQRQVAALDDLLDAIESDDALEDLRHVAYVLATIKHETYIPHTGQIYEPVEEVGRGRGRKYGIKDKATGQIYYGRGFVQLTWRRNYKFFADRLNIDLLRKPELALEPKIAWRITSIGMREGSFTGKSLSDYINDEKCDYRNARRIINGTDKMDLIASYAEKFESILAASKSAGPAELTADASEPLPQEQEAAQQTNKAGGSGQQVVIQPNALASSNVPIVPPDEKPVDVQAVVPEKTGAKKSLWATLIAGVAYIGLNIQAFFTNAYETVKGNPVLAVGLVCGCLVILVVYWKYQERQTKLDELREKQAHELTLKQMELASDQQKYSVNVVKAKP